MVHSVESALWIKLSSSSADLTIYAGDFNTEPKERFSQNNFVSLADHNLYFIQFEVLESKFSDSFKHWYFNQCCDVFGPPGSGSILFTDPALAQTNQK